ncbi:hypothetical protein [Clostridioides difficile]
MPISEQDTTSTIVSKINSLCADNDIKASYSEMTEVNFAVPFEFTL